MKFGKETLIVPLSVLALGACDLRRELSDDGRNASTNQIVEKMELRADRWEWKAMQDKMNAYRECVRRDYELLREGGETNPVCNILGSEMEEFIEEKIESIGNRI